MVNPDNLIWIDLEMTGLDPDHDRILEMAVIVTDSQLNILEESPVLVVHQSDEVLTSMNEWCIQTHGESGLTDRVRASTLTEAEAEAQMLAFVQRYTPTGESPMCGNSIGQDRRFLWRHMPKLHDHFHYRNIDVSTIKELARRWRPELLEQHIKKGSHLALDDIRESIEELQFYRRTFFKG